MISKEEIKKLAELARIEIKEEELKSLRAEIDSILDYVGQVKSVAGERGDKVEIGPLYNVMREDENPNESGAYTKAIFSEAPAMQDGYLKVKKIL